MLGGAGAPLGAGSEGLSSVSLILGAAPLRLVGWLLGE